jgi:hypothetical protein
MSMSAALYAANLLLLSERIIGAVHDDGPDELLRLIDAALIVEAPPGVDPAVALVTVIAAQVDPDTTAEQRLGWVRDLGRVTVAPHRHRLVKAGVTAPPPAPIPADDIEETA